MELLPLDGAVQIGLEAEALGGLMAQIGGVKLIGMATLFLGAVQSGIGIHQQGIGIRAVIGRQGDSHADGDIKIVTVDVERLGQSFQDFVDLGHDIAGRGEVFHQHRVLVATEACHRVAFAQTGFQQAGQGQ